RRLELVPAENLVYMPGIGVDTQFYSPERFKSTHSLIAEYVPGLNVNIPLFLMVAEFIPRKRHKDLLQAFARKEHTAAHLILAGQGKLMGAMKLLTAKLGLEDRVHFLGQRGDIPILMR